MSVFEYRVCWAASSNASFRGKSDWMEWGGFEESLADVEEAIERSGGTLCQGLEDALNFSGFEWDYEVRETTDERREQS